MLASAAKRPPSSDTVAAINDHGGTKWAQCPGGANLRIAIDLAGGIGLEVSTKDAVFATDSHAPAGRPIDPRYLFDDANESARIGFLPAEPAGNPQAE